MASYIAWDARAACDWQLTRLHEGTKLTLAVGVNNLANRMPPLAPRAFLDNNADVSTFSPIGRLVYGTLAITF